MVKLDIPEAARVSHEYSINLKNMVISQIP